MIKGIPCRVKAPDAKGELTDVVTFHFATFRSCPELATKLKAITKLSTQSTKANRLRKIAEDALSTCTDADKLDELCAKLDEASEACEKLDAEALDVYRDFVLTGIVAAGYSKEDAERFVELVDEKMLGELTNKARFGAGRCDFF